jgi:N4-gp56 family major capsid protein
MGITTTVEMPSAVTEFYARLIERPTPFLPHEKYAQQIPLPKGNGKTVKFRKRGAIAVDKTPLGEGVTPPIESFSKVDILATLQQFGRRFGITDMVEWTSADPELTEAVKDVNRLADETRDEIVRDILLSTASVYYAGGVIGRSSIVTAMAEADFNVMRIALLNALAMPIHEKIIKASTGIGTASVDPAFVVITHTDNITGYEALTNFRKVKDYANSSMAEENEFGSLGMFRFIHTTKSAIVADAGGSAVAANLKYTTANTHCDVYRDIVLAKEAYAVCDLAGQGKEIIIKKAGEGDDDLKQRNRVAYKMAFAGRILNDSFMYCYEHGRPA